MSAHSERNLALTIKNLGKLMIYYCSTFREFNGNENHKIQELFLSSLEQQSYGDWHLIATTFGESTVEDYLLERLGSRVTVVRAGRQIYRFSLSEVLDNALNHVRCSEQNCENTLIIWSTCDIILPSGFFADAVNRIGTNFGFTSHPHLKADNVTEFNDNRFSNHGPADGIDLIGFRLDAQKLSAMEKIIKEYRFEDWGVFEHFLVGVCAALRLDLMNLFQAQKIKKIVNDRVPNAETTEYFKSSLQKNWPVMDRFLSDFNLSSRYSSLVYCHDKFSSVQERLTDLFNYKGLYNKFYRMWLRQFVRSSLIKASLYKARN